MNREDPWHRNRYRLRSRIRPCRGAEAGCDGCRESACFATTSRPGCARTWRPDSSSRRCWCPSASPMRRPRACPVSTGSTRRSFRCSPTPCSGRAASWCSGPILRSPPSSSRSSLPLAAGDPGRAVAIASLMAIVSGIACILAGILRLGFITELLSKPIRYGYMNGIALTVLVSQLPKLFGFSAERRRSVAQALGSSAKPCSTAGRTGSRSRWARARSRVIMVLKRFKRLPGILIAVVAATVAVGGVRSGAIRGFRPGLGAPGPPGFQAAPDPVRSARRRW